MINLKTPIPIRLTYITAWVDKNDVLHFWDNVYGCDPALVGDYSVVAIGAKLLNNAVISKHCLIDANAMVLENQHFPDGSLVMGSQGKIKPLSGQQVSDMQWYAQQYLEKIRRYQKKLKLLDPTQNKLKDAL